MNRIALTRGHPILLRSAKPPLRIRVCDAVYNIVRCHSERSEESKGIFMLFLDNKITLEIYS